MGWSLFRLLQPLVGASRLFQMQLRFAFLSLLLAASLCAQAQEPTTFEVGALKFERPPTWQWVPVSSPMRKAQLRIVGTEKDQVADVTFFHFGPGMGGGVDANAKRWIAQFENAKPEDSKIEPQEIGGTKVTLVTTKGVFKSGMPGAATTPMTGYALLGAIIENAGGDVFIKVTGPATLIDQERKAFLQFVAKAVQSTK